MVLLYIFINEGFSFLTCSHHVICKLVELPMLRVAWLRRLADFHSSRKKYAEEATCHFDIYITLRQAARLHNSIWNSTPFLPWTIEPSDGMHLDGEGPAAVASDDMNINDPYYEVFNNDLDDNFSTDENFFFSIEDINSGKHIEKTNSFRRLFYRVPGSLRVPIGDWDVTGNAGAFCGVTSASEYASMAPSSNISVKELEEGT